MDLKQLIKDFWAGSHRGIVGTVDGKTRITASVGCSNNRKSFGSMRFNPNSQVQQWRMGRVQCSSQTI
jgi:hypothetical protein